MEGAVVEPHLHVDDRAAGEEPCGSASTTPFSTAGMNWRGIAPPTMASSNSKPSPRGSGDSSILPSPNCPRPPVCLL